MLRIFLLLFLLCDITLRSQDLYFLDNNYYTWPDNIKVFDAIPNSFKNDDAVILKDDIELNFPERYIKRRQSVKILNETALSYFSSVTLPQNFDITKVNNSIYKQGRFCKRSIPNIHKYKIKYFAVRIIRNKIITELPVNVATNKVYWVEKGGERTPDYEFVFSFDNLEVNDIVEYSYKAEIDNPYDTEQFYVNDYFPKLKAELSIAIAAEGDVRGLNLVLNNNIDSTMYIKHVVKGNKYTYLNYIYKFKNLEAVKYSQNVVAGKTLPHISASGYTLKKNYYSSTMQSTKYIYSGKYTWFTIPDSLYFKTKVYDKYGSNMRQFISTFPENKPDSNKTVFFSQFVDSINTFKYLPAEQMHYGAEDQYSVSSAERLLKRQLVEEFIWDTYNNILFEKNIFYYTANVQDRRFGYHSTKYRSHEAYEAEFIALPVGKSHLFYIPRYKGLKYLPDELPFYYEGTYCALTPKNTSAVKYRQGLNDLVFIKTPLSTYNENVRTENAVFKVNVDSMLIRATIKENLKGQFSTILRPYYNNDFIDSTIISGYFKKCIEKPNSTNQSIELMSQSKTFPFKTTFNCKETIRIQKDSIDLLNWFSFIFAKDLFNKPLTQDYYVDFTFTDTYNFILEFNKPVTIANTDSFSKTLSNDIFEISSSITKQSDNTYLLSLTTKVKQYIIPAQKFNNLTEYVDLLNELNSTKLKLSY